MNKEWAAFSFCTFMFGVAVGAVVVFVTADRHWHKQAVERGYAEYASDTGEWQWIEPTIIVNMGETIRYDVEVNDKP